MNVCLPLRALALAALVSLTAPAALVLAQEGSAQDGGAPGGRRETVAESRSAAFEAVQGPTTEDVPGGSLLLGAYGTILVLLLGYVAWLGRLQSTTARDLDRLQKALDRAPKSE